MGEGEYVRKERERWWLLFLVLGSVIEVRVRLLPFSVRVLRAHVVPLLHVRPQPPVPGAVLCGATRRAGLLGAGSREDGVDGDGAVRLVLLLISRPRPRVRALLCPPHYNITIFVT